MFQNRPALFLGLSITIALVTTVMIYNWLNSQKQQPVPPVEKEVAAIEGMSIAVAGADVAWGTPLTKDMVRMVRYPKENLPTGHFDNVEDLKDRVLLTHLQQNAQILESKLAPKDIKTGGVAAVMNPNKRAMAVKVNEVVALPGFVKPGDRVDVMVTFVDQKRKQITKTILENMLVLAIGTQMERDSQDKKPRPVKIITFEVSLEEAEKLAMASNGGQLRLALRSPINTELEKTRGATFRDLKASFPKNVVRKRGKRVRPRIRVEVIKGNARKVVKF